jgi:hypothetical protein
LFGQSISRPTSAYVFDDDLQQMQQQQQQHYQQQQQQQISTRER